MNTRLVGGTRNAAAVIESTCLVRMSVRAFGEL